MPNADIPRFRHPTIELEPWQVRDAATHWLNLAKHRSELWRLSHVYSEEKYLAAIESAPLKPKVKQTLVATAATATTQGVTTVSRLAIADEVGIRDADTITAHWRTAEEAGYLTSKRRFNTSKVIQLLIPPTTAADLMDDVKRLPWPDKATLIPPF
jgi:hypothetical protein